MSLFAQLSPLGQSVVKSFVRQRTRSPQSFCFTVSPEDEMYLYGAADDAQGDVDDWFLSYLETGVSMMDELWPIVDQVCGGFDKIESLLESACGHGRLTQYLVHEIDAESFGLRHLC